ncbi:hypothetical protein A3E86_05365 [Candidatus Daviesbacteria bacterium RIFCSPHIGHO2_12_FULL_47_45]|nr:MAG: hypothetical protein A3E86_05365 [Candidatus Daviesbacteria bacterium RIFCSPHIGHO2_12_FULL_47_45]
MLCLLGLSWFAGSGAPYIPTKYPKLKELFKLAGLKPDDDFYELGSGDGRVVLVAAQMGAESFGIEESWLRVWWSRWKAYQLKLSNAHFFHGSIFTRHYFSAEVVYIYMLPVTVDRLEPILKEELKPGAKVITQKYHFKNWKPTKTIDDFYIYTKT